MKRIFGLIVGALFCGVVLSYGVTQEVPVGKVKGTLQMEENQKPLADAVVTLSVIGAPEEDRPSAKGVETRANGSFEFPPMPTGVYHLEISAGHHRMDEKIVSIEEGQTQNLELWAQPNPAYLNLYASQRVFTPDETPKIELQGFVEADDVKVAVYRLDVEDIAKKGGLQETLSPLASPNAGDVRHLDKAGQKVGDLSHRITKRDAEGAFVEPLAIGKLPEGYYFVTCTAGDKRASTSLNVSRLALVTKTYREHTLCFATDITSGQPVADVEILSQTKEGLKAVGRTSADGTLQTTLSPAPESHAAVIGRKNGSVALVGFLDERPDDAKIRIVGYCERPAYRPGDEIQFKGVVRRFGKDGYVLPGRGTADVQINDPDGNKLQTLTLPVSPHGTFHGSFRTSPEAKPGGYSIDCKAFGGRSEGMFANVVAYRKPEYSVEVTSDRPYYVMGNQASATVECRYYYGGPVVGAKVKASVYRSPAWRYEGEEEDVASWSDGGGEYSEEIEAVTDASGRAKIEFPTRADNDPDTFTNDYIYNINASVTEDGGKYFDGQGEVKVVRGDHDLTIEVQNPVLQPGEVADLLVKTTDAVKRDVPSPNQTVSIEVGREVWTRNESVFVPRQTLEATTGPDGTVHVRVPVEKAESLSFRAKSRDANGHEIVAEAWAYVEGSPAMAERQEGSMEITLDRRKYAPGDQARVLLQTDMPGGAALVCLQADGILWQRVVPITSTSTLLTVPVVKEFAPDVFVSVAYVREKRFLEADKRMNVSRVDHDLKVEVRSDRETYKPGETARVTVRTTDAAGHPRAAEVSVGVVDEGIYAIAADETNLNGALYPERYEGVRTNYSFPEIYLDGGDKGSSKVPLRTRFRDTAAWVPSVWTGDSGEATVPISLPDNLTEWRVTAVGVTDSSEAGQGTRKFRARKDLMVRLQLPQFMVDGDRQRMTVVVANDTGRDQDVNVEVQGEGVSLANAKRQTVRVPNGRPQTLEIDVTAGGPGDGAITARAWIDRGPNDGVRQSFPIEPHGRKLLDGRSGEANASFTLPIRATADPRYGSLKISVSPTLAGDLLGSLDALIGFPYGCTEQTMDRFLPSVLVAKAVKELGLPHPAKLRDLDRIVRDSVTRLERMQHNDGGWGWWEYDDSSPFMTALVLDGVERARRAGYEVNLNTKGAVQWGVERLKNDAGKKDSLRDRLYLVYALLRYGRREAATALKGVDVSKLTPIELANAVLAFHEAGDEANASLARERLAATAQGGDGVAYWPWEEGAWGAEVTALALVAFEEVRPDDPIVPRIVRYLMASRKGDIWASTRDTSYSLIGLTAFLSHNRELSSATTVNVRVNGRPVRTVTMDPRETPEKGWNMEIPRSGLGNGDVRIDIEKQGSGVCYYTAELRTLDTANVLEAESTDPGLKVERRYYRLEPRRLENGTMRLLPSAAPVDSFRSGDLVRVELLINTDTPRRYVMIEEPTPSNCRVQEREELGPYEDWGYWWSRTVLRDDRVAFFATWLPAGRSKISYTMRAEQAGRVRVLPTSVGNMYDPTRQSSPAEAILEVQK